MKKKQELRKKEGITLVALVVTIVILIILATISVNLVINGGLISKTENGAELHRKEAAKEKLSLALGSASLEKRMNQKYNPNSFLDKFILKEIPDAKILGDVVVVDRYGFEIDRSVPKIGKYVGKESELVFPELRLEKEIAEDSKSAVIKITAKEEKNGISKIEILEDGFVIDSYPYDNKKEEIIENYEVSRNGDYVIKVYSALSRTEMIEVSELVANIKYSPNGNEEYKKEHTVQVSVDKTVDEVTSIKYQWTNTTEEPLESSFIQSCTDGAKIAKNEVTGSWYLWTLIETEAGKKRIERSEAFHFDNEEPQVELTSTPTSETSFTLTVIAIDAHSGIEKYEFYVEDELMSTQGEKDNIYVWNYEGMAEKKCYVLVRDKAGNQKRVDTTARTKLFSWKKYETNIERRYEEKTEPFEGWCTRWYEGYSQPPPEFYINGSNSYSFDETTGKFAGSKEERFVYKNGATLPINCVFFLPGGWGTQYYTGNTTCIEIRQITATPQIRADVWIVGLKHYAELIEENYTMGNEIGKVYGTRFDLYPENGHTEDGFWYIFDGIV